MREPWVREASGLNAVTQRRGRAVGRGCRAQARSQVFYLLFQNTLATTANLGGATSGAAWPIHLAFSTYLGVLVHLPSAYLVE